MSCGAVTANWMQMAMPPIGNTVDVANATWTNTIGAAEMITIWEDPDLKAFYYAA